MIDQLFTRTELIAATQAAAKVYTDLRSKRLADDPLCLSARAAYKEAQRQEIGAAEAWEPYCGNADQPLVLKTAGVPSLTHAAPAPKRKKIAAVKAEPLPITKQCAFCGGEFTSCYKRKIYCDDTCKTRAEAKGYKARQKETEKPEVSPAAIIPAAIIPAAPVNAAPASPAVSEPLRCLMCKFCRRAFLGQAWETRCAECAAWL